MITELKETSVIWQSIDIQGSVKQIILNTNKTWNKNVFKISKILFRLLMFKCKIEKAFFSDEFIVTALDCVSHVQSLSLLLRKTIKQKHRYPCVRNSLK